MNGLAVILFLQLALLDGCQAADRVPATVPPARSSGQTDVATSSGTAWAYFRANGITEIRYVRFPSYVADAKPVRVLNVGGLSPQRDGAILALLDKADVGLWKTCYEDERVSDGMCWTVEIVAGDKVIKRINGFNAEPPGLRFLLRACGLGRDGRRRPVLDDD